MSLLIMTDSHENVYYAGGAAGAAGGAAAGAVAGVISDRDKKEECWRVIMPAYNMEKASIQEHLEYAKCIDIVYQEEKEGLPFGEAILLGCVFMIIGLFIYAMRTSSSAW